MSPVHAIFVHGVGTQSSNFSDDSQKWLASALSTKGRTLYGASVLWSPLLDGPERKMLKEVGKRGSSNRPSQRLVVNTLADALCYRHYQESINYLLDYEIKRVGGREITIFAHSLGCLLTLDYLRQRPDVKVKQLVTMGCNLELFHLGRTESFDCPSQVAYAGKWWNLFDEDDMLGWPVRAWLPHVQDVEVSVGGWLTGWTGLSHTAYWGDKSIWKNIVPGLLKI